MANSNKDIIEIEEFINSLNKTEEGRTTDVSAQSIISKKIKSVQNKIKLLSNDQNNLQPKSSEFEENTIKIKYLNKEIQSLNLFKDKLLKDDKFISFNYSKINSVNNQIKAIHEHLKEERNKDIEKMKNFINASKKINNENSKQLVFKELLKKAESSKKNWFKTNNKFLFTKYKTKITW